MTGLLFDEIRRIIDEFSEKKSEDENSGTTALNIYRQYHKDIYMYGKQFKVMDHFKLR